MADNPVPDTSEPRVAALAISYDIARTIYPSGVGNRDANEGHAKRLANLVNATIRAYRAINRVEEISSE